MPVSYNKKAAGGKPNGRFDAENGGEKMELRVLNYFLAVVREGTISGAAERLHISQPTLSRQLSELEEELGKPLFLRGNRRISLTEEGMLFCRRAREISDLAEKTVDDIQNAENMVGGTVYIGGGETEAMRLPAAVCKKLMLKYPDIRFSLYSGDADDVAERLEKGLLDFGVFVEPADLKKYDGLRLPQEDTWGILMRKDSPLARMESIRPADLQDLPLLCSQRALVKNELAQWMKSDYGKLKVAANYNLIYNAALMVEEGVGYAFCLDKLVNTGGESKLCFRPLEPRLRANLDLVWKKHRVLSRAAQAFLEALKEELASA